MAQVNLKGLHLNVVRRNGTFEHRTRRGPGAPVFAQTPFRLTTPLSGEYAAKALEAIMAERGAPALKAAKEHLERETKGGLSFADLVSMWKASPEWRKYAARTVERHEAYMAVLLAAKPQGKSGTFADMPIAAIELPESKALFMRARADYSLGWRRIKSTPELLAQHHNRRGDTPPAGSGKGGAYVLGDIWVDTSAKPNPAVREWSERLAAADELLRSAQSCFTWGVDNGVLRASPLANITALYTSNRADLVWQQTDFDRFKPHASEVVWSAVYLMALTGLAPVDLIALTWGELDADAIELGRGRSKTGVRVVIPIYDELADWLGVLRSRFVAKHGRQPEAGDTVLLTSHGTPWTGDGLRASVRKCMEAAGMDQGELNFYDLRGTAATRLKAVPLEDAEIAAILGWTEARVKDIIKRYVDRRNLTRKLADKISRAPRAVA